jgi:hypothetical protein
MLHPNLAVRLRHLHHLAMEVAGHPTLLMPRKSKSSTAPVSTFCTNGTTEPDEYRNKRKAFDDLTSNTKRVNNATHPSYDNKKKPPPKKTKITQGRAASSIGSEPATIDFRDCVDDQGINMPAKKKLIHSHKPVDDSSSIQHEGMRKIYHVVDAFFRWASKKNFKYKNGEPFVPNRPSLPLGLDEDAVLVGLVLCYVTLEEGKPLHAHGRSCFTATHSEEDTLVCCI